MSILDILPLAVSAVGLIVLGNWYYTTGGLKSLDDSPDRRNSMPVYTGFVAVVVWLLLGTVNMGIVTGVFGESEEWVQDLATYLLTGVCEVGMIVAILWLAKRYFGRGIKGFGLDARTVGADVKWAFVNLIAIYPLVLIGLLVVMLVIEGDIPKHETLLTMSGDNPLVLRVVSVLFAVLLAPIFEEILFRGLFQTMVRSATDQPWIAIVMTSVIFVMMHASKTHWLGLFGLSVGMGYAYERSGSLYRSIFIHIMFNGISVIGTLVAVD